MEKHLYKRRNMKILVSACLLQYKYTKKIVKRSSIIHIFLLMKDQYDIPKRYLLQITLKRNASSATAELLFHF